MERVEVTADELLAEIAAQMPGDFDAAHEVTIEDVVRSTGRSYMIARSHLVGEVESGRMTWRYAIRDGRRVRAFRRAPPPAPTPPADR